MTDHAYAPAASAEQNKTLSSETRAAPPTSLTRSSDAVFTRAGKFERPPLIVPFDATRDDVVALAAARAAKLRDLLAFLIEHGGEPAEDLAPADVARLVFDDAEDVFQMLCAAAEGVR